MEKLCGRCGVVKRLDEFAKDRTRPDGRFHYCKACERRRIAARRQTREYQEIEKMYRAGRGAEAAERWRKSDHGRAYLEAYRRIHPEIGRQASARRRRRLLANGGDLTREEFWAVCESCDWLCAACGLPLPLGMDHVIPVVMGGPTSAWNIQPLCRWCNSLKGVLAIDFRVSGVDQEFYKNAKENGNMKAISVQKPIGALVFGGVTSRFGVINREKRVRYRGWLLIHQNNDVDPFWMEKWSDVETVYSENQVHDLPAGIIGIAKAVGCDKEMRGEYDIEGQWHLRLEMAYAFVNEAGDYIMPFDCQGQMGLFDVPWKDVRGRALSSMRMAGVRSDDLDRFDRQMEEYEGVKGEQDKDTTEEEGSKRVFADPLEDFNAAIAKCREMCRLQKDPAFRSIMEKIDERIDHCVHEFYCGDVNKGSALEKLQVYVLALREVKDMILDPAKRIEEYMKENGLFFADIPFAVRRENDEIVFYNLQRSEDPDCQNFFDLQDISETIAFNEIAIGDAEKMARQAKFDKTAFYRLVAQRNKEKQQAA